MTASEIKQLAEAIAQGTALSWTHILLAALAIGVAAFLGTYLAQKAKNTATKEDVADITRRIESVRLDYTAKLEELKGSYQLHVAALERRLEVHQKSFSMWRRLIFAVYSDDIGKVCRECEDWWTDHCIYLAPEARDAFMSAVGAAHGHREYVRGRLPREKLEANWKTILDAGNAIMKGASLPPLPSESLPKLPS